MILPSLRRTATANIWWPSVVAVVSQTWSPQTTGEDQPWSWMAVFQTTFSVSLHRSGKPTQPEWPSPRGPRKAGQLSAARDFRQAITSER